MKNYSFKDTALYAFLTHEALTPGYDWCDQRFEIGLAFIASRFSVAGPFYQPEHETYFKETVPTRYFFNKKEISFILDPPLEVEAKALCFRYEDAVEGVIIDAILELSHDAEEASYRNGKEWDEKFLNNYIKRRLNAKLKKAFEKEVVIKIFEEDPIQERLFYNSLVEEYEEHDDTTDEDFN